MAQQSIPDYFVYGEPARSLEVGFMHVEMVSARKNLHRGNVEPHKHAEMGQITFWIKGGGIYSIEDQSWTFSAPAISFVPSGVVHGFAVSEQSDAIVLSISNDAIQNVLPSADAPKLYATFLDGSNKGEQWRNFKVIMQMILQEYQRQQPNMQNMISHLAGLILNLISRGAVELHDGDFKQFPPLAQRLRQAIDLHFREQRTIAQYVKQLNTTYHLLDKSARSSFGKPIKQLILDRRMLEAKRLLKFTIRSAENIAYELGFDDPAYFNCQFKLATGLAPGRWRNKKS